AFSSGSTSPVWTLSRPSTLRFWHPCHGDDVMDRNNRIGRREPKFSKFCKALARESSPSIGGQLRPLRPNTILAALAESIARRNVVFGRPSSTSFGLGVWAMIRGQAADQR